MTFFHKYSQWMLLYKLCVIEYESDAYRVF